MLDNTLSPRILKAVDAGFEEQVAFTKELIRFPSKSGLCLARASTSRKVVWVSASAVTRRNRISAPSTDSSARFLPPWGYSLDSSDPNR